jgi:signal transduction histidine kinase
MSNDPQQSLVWLPAAVSGLRHDLLSNLTGVVGLAQALEHEIRSKLEAIENDLRAIRRLSSAAADMLADLTDLTSSPDRPRVGREVFELGALLVELEEEFASMAQRKGLAFHCNGRDLRRNACIATDRRKLARILSNLVGNAVRYTAAGRIELIGYWDAKSARVEVADTGPGMPTDFVDRYISSERLGAPPPGVAPAGLGLWVARGLADLIGIKLTLEARPGGGSLFTLHLSLPDERDSSEFSLG